MDRVGCPHCASPRLRSAPLPVVSTIVRIASHKRRYRCSECHWTGYRHRLERGEGLSTDEIFNGHEVHRKAVWYFVIVTIAFVLFLGTVMKQCADEAPIPPDDITSSAPGAAVDI